MNGAMFLGGRIVARKTKTYSLEERLRLQPFITSDQVRLILEALPAQTIDTRIKKLPEVLPRWYQTELVEHVGFGPNSEDENLLGKADRLIRSANEIRKLIATPYGDKLRDIIGNKGWEVAGINPTSVDLAASEARLDDLMRFLAEIETALNEYVLKHKRIRGRPRNSVPVLILLDISELYGWVTGSTPTRQYDSPRSTETGPFYHFASAIWQVIFGNTHGLKSAVRSWGNMKDEKDRSALIYNMGLDIAEYGE
jgi:hypothetical protein